MIIKKLIITSVNNIYTNHIFQYIEGKQAGELIKERLYMGNSYDTKIARAVRKIPKSIRDWVNPNCLVIKNRKFVYDA